MKAKTRNALIAAAILCIAGVVLMLAGLIPVGFDLTKLQHITMETHTEETRKPLEQIVIGVSGADVKIQASDDEVCTVTCIEQEGLTYTIAVKDKTLTVKENPDIRKWYQRIVSFPAQHHSVTVYLPKREYEQLDIRTVGGTISVTDGTYRTMQLYSANGDAAISPEVRVFSACSIHTVSGNISSRTIGRITSVSLEATNGDINADQLTANDLRVHTVSGNIDIGGMQIDSEASFKTTSGDIKIIESQSGELITQNVSGNTILTDTQITGSAACKATSGDIKLNRVDMDSFEAKTVSGNITGSLLSPKLFSAQSNSGRVKVPSAVSGNAQAGLCILTTTSGDIRMEIHQ